MSDKTYQSFRFEVDPNNATRLALMSHAGAARFAYNWALALVKAQIDARRVLIVLAQRQGASQQDAQSWAENLLGPLPWTMISFRREWTLVRNEVAPWHAENAAYVYDSGFDALARGLRFWSQSRRHLRVGTPAGFPGFKKRTARRSFRTDSVQTRLVDPQHLRLPRIGVIRAKESLAPLLAKIAAGTARTVSVAVTEQCGRWYVGFTCEVTLPAAARNTSTVVGIDLGIRNLAVLSTGEVVPNPHHMERYSRRIARGRAELARRQGPSPDRRPSKRWEQSKRRLGRSHARVAAARNDGIHKITTRLAKHYDTVVIEDLNVMGLSVTARGCGDWRSKTGKANMNRAMREAGPGIWRRHLTYKCRWYGSALLVADRWYPSSKTCSACGWRKPSQSLAERTFRCEECGVVIDRDLNAALNLAALAGVANGTASGAGTGRSDPANAQGEERFMASALCSSGNCENGSGLPDRTATSEITGHGA